MGIFMKKLFIFVVFLLFAIQAHASLKFSPYTGFDYSSKFGSSTKPIFGMEFSYEFNNGLEFGFGSYLSKTKVAGSGDELLPSNFIDFSPEVKENPTYLILKYNFKVNDNIKISPYGKLGRLNTSIYDYGSYNYNILIDTDTQRMVNIVQSQTILYGNDFYAFGLQYSYKNYYLSVEYKIRLLEQDYSYSNSTIDYDVINGNGTLLDSTYSSNTRTYKANSVSFLIGYTFDSKNRSQMEDKEQQKRYKKGDIQE